MQIFVLLFEGGQWRRGICRRHEDNGRVGRSDLFWGAHLTQKYSAKQHMRGKASGAN